MASTSAKLTAEAALFVETLSGRAGYKSGHAAICLLAAFASAQAAPPAPGGAARSALMCTVLNVSVDDARSQLKRATQADSLEDGQDYARQAESALDDAAIAANPSGTEFADSINWAIRSYDDALVLLRSCKPRR